MPKNENSVSILGPECSAKGLNRKSNHNAVGIVLKKSVNGQGKSGLNSEFTSVAQSKQYWPGNRGYATGKRQSFG